MINLDDLYKTLDKIESLEMKKLNFEQLYFLKKEYNFYGNFEYNKNIFIMHKHDFSNFEYYLGMEYEADFINIKIDYLDKIIVEYDEFCDRAKKIVEELEEIR